MPTVSKLSRQSNKSQQFISAEIFKLQLQLQLLLTGITLVLVPIYNRQMALLPGTGI